MDFCGSPPFLLQHSQLPLLPLAGREGPAGELGGSCAGGLAAPQWCQLPAASWVLPCVSSGLSFILHPNLTRDSQIRQMIKKILGDWGGSEEGDGQTACSWEADIFGK